jgi:hypothetical protein
MSGHQLDIQGQMADQTALDTQAMATSTSELQGLEGEQQQSSLDMGNRSLIGLDLHLQIVGALEEQLRLEAHRVEMLTTRLEQHVNTKFTFFTSLQVYKFYKFYKFTSFTT